MTATDLAPKGEMVLHTLTMPANTNASGDIPGGWLMSQVGIGGTIMAKGIIQGHMMTVRMDGMAFLRSIAVDDVMCCYVCCVKRGSTLVMISIEVWVKKVSSEPIGQRYGATRILFIYVAISNWGEPRALPAE